MLRPIEKICGLFAALLLIPAFAFAGPFAPAAGEPGTTAIHMDDPAFVAWATGYVDYLVGDEVDSTWQRPEKALGKAVGNSFDIVSLGRGGTITLTFENPIKDGDGWDFAVFENAVNNTFLELAFVEVSSDNFTFVRFDNHSLTANPVGGFGAIDPTNIDGFGGKYRQGYGTPFNLEDLESKQAVKSGLVNLDAISYVRITDIVGEGSYADTYGRVIYDPYPTVGSAGFDLDAIGVIHQQQDSDGQDRLSSNNAPHTPILFDPPDLGSDIALGPRLATQAFSDPDSGDTHTKTRWQISTDSEFNNIVFDIISSKHLTAYGIPDFILQGTKQYFWHVKFFDNNNAGSQWSAYFAFTTQENIADLDQDGIPDDQAVADTIDLDEDGTPDNLQAHMLSFTSWADGVVIGIKVPANAAIQSAQAVDPASISDDEGKPDEMPFGLVSFNVLVETPGDTATITIYISEPASEDAAWVNYDAEQGWQDYAGLTETHVPRGESTEIKLTLQDGGIGDADGVANGVIVDPGGLGMNSSPSIPQSGAAGVGGGSGCFAATAANGPF